MSVKIVTDSACDLPLGSLGALGITVVPLIVRFGDEEFAETELGIDEYWARVETARTHSIYPQTSQPSVGAFETAFAPLVAAGHQVLCPVVTSKHSGTYNSAMVAAQSFPGQVVIFDSWSLSLGLGFMVEAAATAARRGAGVDEVLLLLESMRPRTHLFAALDTIEFIRRGGRADATMPILNRVTRFLDVKVIIGFDEGELKLKGQGRPFSKALERIEQRVLKLGPLERLGVIHTRRPNKAQKFALQLWHSTSFHSTATVCETGAALSSHAGPNIIGVVAVQQRINIPIMLKVPRREFATTYAHA